MPTADYLSPVGWMDWILLLLLFTIRGLNLQIQLCLRDGWTSKLRLFFRVLQKAVCAWTRGFAVPCLPLLFLHLLSPAHLQPVPTVGMRYPWVAKQRHGEVKPIFHGQISNGRMESSALFGGGALTSSRGVVEEPRCGAAVASASLCPWASAPAPTQDFPCGDGGVVWQQGLKHTLEPLPLPVLCLQFLF